MTDRPPSSRRALLRGAGAVLASASLAGCEGILGSTGGTSTATVTPVPLPGRRVVAGPDGFDPPSLRAPPGTTIVWEWTSDGHNIEVQSRPEGSVWEGHEAAEGTGFTYEHTFEVEGTYDYYCRAHEGEHVPGARITIASGAPTPTPAVAVDRRGRDEVAVTVGPMGELAFDPEALRISTGTTVTWRWDSPGHNLVPETQPDEASWEGHEPLEDEGFTDSHTFSVRGRYEYVCLPHEEVGMTGAILVE